METNLNELRSYKCPRCPSVGNINGSVVTWTRGGMIWRDTSVRPADFLPGSDFGCGQCQALKESAPLWERDPRAREALLYLRSLDLTRAEIVAECESLFATLPKCQCQWEAGDSPCPVHGDE